MVVVGIAWVVATPYCVGLLVASSKRANRLVANHLRLSTMIGWSSVAALLFGVFVLRGEGGLVLAACAAPLSGLAFWTAGPRGDNGGGGDSDAPGDDPGPGDQIDWDQFLRDVDDWQRSRIPA